MSLFDIQRAFRDHLLAGQDAPLAAVAPKAMRGLGVYRHAYRAQLAASLRDTFEKTWAWMGDEAFDAAAREHIARHPPKSWTLNDYGADFAATLRALHPDDPEIAEIAWLDWCLRRAFEGPDADPVAPEKLGEVDWDSAVLIFLPTLAVGQAITNSAAIWGAIADDQPPPAAQKLPSPAAIRVWRSGLTPRYRSIENFEHRALILAMAGSGFADLCGLLVEKDDRDQAVQRVGTALAGWLHDGLITAVRQA